MQQCPRAFFGLALYAPLIAGFLLTGPRFAPPPPTTHPLKLPAEFDPEAGGEQPVLNELDEQLGLDLEQQPDRCAQALLAMWLAFWGKGYTVKF